MSALQEQEIPKELYQQLDDKLEVFEAEFAPDICNTLGLMAVKGDLARAVIITEAEPWLDSELPDANGHVTKSLQETRDRIAAIDPDRRNEIGSKVLDSKVPQFLLTSLGVKYDHQIFERLIEKTPDGSYAVSDDALLNLLQWHNYHMTTAREKFMEKHWPILKQSYLYKLKDAVKDGWLPGTVLKPERLNALEQVAVTVDDGMMMHEEGSEAFMSTYDTASSTEVYFPRFAYMKTAYHELSHVMVGVSVPRSNSKGRFSGGLVNRGLYRLFDKSILMPVRLLMRQ